MKSPKPWTDAEIAFIEKYWQTSSVRSIAQHLRRPEISVKKKLERLGLRKTGPLSPAEIDFLRLAYPAESNDRIAAAMRRYTEDIRGLAASIGVKKAWYYDICEPDFEPAPCDRPTLEEPGSWGRVMEYRRRIERGLELFHPDDKRTSFVRVWTISQLMQ